MKICTLCKQEKSLSNFTNKKRNKDGKNARCSDCTKIISKDHYIKNVSVYVQKARNNDIKYLDRNRKWLLGYFEDKCCLHCGITDMRVFQFDHRETSLKVDSVSCMMRSSSLEKLQIEIEKCDILCANCHQIKTAEQFKHWKFLLS